MLKKMQIQTNRRDEMIDITHEAEAFLRKTGVKNGLALIYCPHTTAGITINENADPDVKRDMLKGLMKCIRGSTNWTGIWREIRRHI